MATDPYSWLKALHLIAVIFWMAGLMYLPRLYVYHWQAKAGGEMEKALVAQERRLLKIIMNPAMVAAFLLGIGLFHYAYLSHGFAWWLILKLVLVFSLMGYHMIMAGDRKKFERGERPRSEKTYRVLNEVPAVLIICVVLLAILKPF